MRLSDVRRQLSRGFPGTFPELSLNGCLASTDVWPQWMSLASTDVSGLGGYLDFGGGPEGVVALERAS